MRTQSTDRRIPHIPCQRASITHIALTITYVAIIGLPSLLTTPLPGRASGRLSPTPTPTASEGLSPTPTPTARPSPSPTGPPPPVLSQVLVMLQAKNRLLYTGNASLPEIALTFDDGPNPYYTPQILAILQQYRVPATFFCIGRQVARYPDLVRQEYNDGNLVGNHTWSHPNLALLSSSEILTQINLTA